jgi:uncharacterized protein YjbI with pentapeptide repeats
MANEEHLARLKQGVEAWNQWRSNSIRIQPDLGGADLSEMLLWKVNLSEALLWKADLSGADLSEADLTEANLTEANLRGADLYRAAFFKADLSEADLCGATLTEARLSQTKLCRALLRGANLFRAALFWADLSEADLSGADLSEADLTDVDLSEANLTGANLCGALLRGANLSGADLSGAALEAAILVKTNFKGANLTGCKVYGIAAWNVNLIGAKQSDIVITPAVHTLVTDMEPTITVDNLEVAQFIYLLLHNEKIREVIDTITAKAVLILGRFTPERKAVLDAIRDELRRYDYLPIMFDFQKPEGRNYIETVSTLAHMARFVIADITDAKVVLQELERIVPGLPSVPVQPIVQAHTDVSVVIIDFVGRLNFLEQLYVYRDLADVQANLHSKIIQPAEAQLTEIHAKRLQFLEQIRQITYH